MGYGDRSSQRGRSGNALPVLLLAGLLAAGGAGCMMPLAEDRGDAVASMPNIQAYARELEARLLRRYNNHPEHAGDIGQVRVVLTDQPLVSINGQEVRVEYSQLVYDKWGNRVSDLEQEYYVVTFGDGSLRRISTRPKLTVGMANEGGFSETATANMGRLRALPHDPNRHLPEPRTLRNGGPDHEEMAQPPAPCDNGPRPILDPRAEPALPMPTPTPPCDTMKTPDPLDRHAHVPPAGRAREHDGIPVVAAEPEVLIPVVVPETVPSRDAAASTLALP